MDNERKSMLTDRLQEMFADLLDSTKNPDSEVTVDTLKAIIKGALGDRYTESQLDKALEGLGVPKNGAIKVHEFCAQLATPTAYAIKQMREDNLGTWLTVGEWQQVMERLGMNLTMEETEKMLQKTKKQTLDDVARERLALEKIGIDLTNDDLQKIISDAQKTVNTLSSSSDDSEYETEEEIILSE
ncbi:uncharacterized protein LOC106666286 [Cimex lectularius]|uniref:Uncharacterized protein n=1 Tax=Cimex lectularius TaxID=79782 RepID=A0A8I6RM54_CIMLE|nr:uncharacterized protein LOC106666286 [Cimex lectularius]